MAFLLSHAAALAFLLGIALVTGQLIEAVAPLPQATRGRLRAIALGLAAWMYLLFALAALQLFNTVAVGLALGAVAIIGMPLLIRLWKKAPPPAQARWPLAAWAVAAVAGAGLAALFLPTLSPDIGWDDNAYHLTVPRLWIEHGGFRRLPYNVYSNWPMNVDLLFGLALLVQDQVLAKLVHTATLGLMVAQVAKMASRKVAPELAWLGALPLLASPVVQFEAQIAYNDIALGFFFLVALEQVLDALETRDRAAMVLAGVFGGVLAGSKVSGGIYAVCLLLVLAGGLLLQRVRFRQVVASSLWFSVPVLLLVLPWALKTWILTGNPIYPFAHAVFGGPEWSGELHAAFTQWQRSIGPGRETLDYLLLPWRVVKEAGGSYQDFGGHIGGYWLALLPLALVGLWRDSTVRRCMALVALNFALWAATSQQARFLIPLLGPLSVACAVSLGRWIPGPGARPVALALSLSFVLSVEGLWTHLRFPLPAVADARAYLASPTPGMYRFINETTPPTAKVMMLNVNHGFFLRRAFVADSFFEASQVAATFKDAKSTEEVVATLRRLGITHLLLKHRDWGIRYPRPLLDFLSGAPVVRAEGGFTLYAVP